MRRPARPVKTIRPFRAILSRMSRLKASVLKLAVALGAVAAGLLVMEGLVRLTAPAYDPSGHVRFTHLPDGTAIGPPNLTRRMVKNTGDYDVEVAFNAVGFRDWKSLTTSTPDSIFVVGDSFALGWGVEERQRFSNLLQERLGRLVFNISSGSADFDRHSFGMPKSTGRSSARSS